MTAIRIDGLSIDYEIRGRQGRALADATLEMIKGESVALVGESGAGKSTLGLAVLGLLPPNALIVSGSLVVDGTDFTHASEEQWRSIRWRTIALIPQGAMNALNPVHRIADQIAEPMRVHLGLRRTEARQRAGELLDLVGIPSRRGTSYPHEFSGGMKQRACIAMALACEPDIIIADEPTTALDVVVQRQILDLLNRLKEELQLSMLFVTHDLGIVKQLCERVVVLYGGRIVEEGRTKEVFSQPLHPYTRLLLASVPSIGARRHPGVGIPGSVPSLFAVPEGCPFHPRCPRYIAPCSASWPQLYHDPEGRSVWCHLYPESGGDDADGKLHNEQP